MIIWKNSPRYKANDMYVLSHWCKTRFIHVFVYMPEKIWKQDRCLKDEMNSFFFVLLEKKTLCIAIFIELKMLSTEANIVYFAPKAEIPS